MSGGNNKPQLPAPRQLSDETIRALIEQQAREADNRAKELQLRTIELQQNANHAKEILNAQERDREAERVHTRKSQRDKLIFAAIIVLLLVGMMVLGLYLQQPALVRDILQTLFTLAAGAIGGYGAAKVKAKQEKDEE